MSSRSNERVRSRANHPATVRGEYVSATLSVLRSSTVRRPKGKSAPPTVPLRTPNFNDTFFPIF